MGDAAERNDKDGLATVAARPSAELWGVSAFLAVGCVFLCGLALTTPERHVNGQTTSQTEIYGLCATLILLIGGIAAWAVCSSPWEITASADGLTWRTWRGRRRAAWGDVRDFHTRTFATGNSRVGPRACIVTSVGNVWFTPQWRDADALKRFIAQHAPAAPACEWATLGTRPDADFPQTFGYHSAENWQRAWVAAAQVGMSAGVLVFFIGPKVPRIIGEMGWAWGLSMIAVMILVMAGLPLLMVCVAVLPTFLDARRRRGEAIVADRDGLVWTDERTARRVVLPWGDITDYGIGEPIGRLRGGSYRRIVRGGAKGEEITFSFALANAAILCEIIAKQAVNARAHAAADGKWRSLTPGADVDVLGGEGARWTGGVAGVGGRVFHYRTRTNRAMLWFLWAFALIVLLTISLNASGMTQARSDNGGDAVIGTLTFLMTATAAYATWRYYAGRVVTNGDGVTQYAPTGRRFLRWKDITDYEVKGEASNLSLIVRDASGVTVRFSEMIVDADELKGEIARRAPRPVHGWGDASGKAGTAETVAKPSRASRA